VLATKLAIACLALSSRTGCGLLMNDLADHQRDTKIEEMQRQLDKLRGDLLEATVAVSAGERQRTAREVALARRVDALERELASIRAEESRRTDEPGR
jgi:hypothetical protein